ncbi:MAG: L,D-transpeptidase family protein [Anaerolineales bacterium]|nr:L,D-transpeptidase family protein [Anaerolineales bacterium]
MLNRSKSMVDQGSITRRDAIKIAGLGFSAAALQPWVRSINLPEFPSSEWLGRVCTSTVNVRARPDGESETIGVLYEDTVVPWLREIAGKHRSIYSPNVRWVETNEGYIWSPRLQPVQNRPNEPQHELPMTSLGAGMWVEVTVPYVDIVQENPPARSPWLKHAQFPRLYYSQVLWVDEVKTDSQGQVWYRVNERYGYGDIFWAVAEAFRPLTDDDLAPIHPEVEDKRIVVNLTYQTLSCYEGNSEVYFCRISSGAKFDSSGNPVDEWSTPLGPHPIWRKVVSLHMSGGTTGGGYDLPGIGWTTLFVGNGVAIHGTFWHNNFGVPVSHGCVNARSEDAKWIFRWTTPRVTSDPGDITVAMPGGTIVFVEEA